VSIRRPMSVVKNDVRAAETERIAGLLERAAALRADDPDPRSALARRVYLDAAALARADPAAVERSSARQERKRLTP